MKPALRIVTVLFVLLSLCLPVATLAQGADVTALPLVKFRGVVHDRPEDPVGEWVIGEQTVTVTEETRIIETNGPATVGATVTVIAKKLADETLEALIIRVEKLQEGDVVYLRGRIAALGQGWLVVNGMRVQITEQTRIRGELRPGAMVSIQARIHEGALVAEVIIVEPEGRIVEFVGTIISMGEESWVIDGRTVRITESTIIIGEPVEGAKVRVRALVMPTASSAEEPQLVALTIHVLPGTPEPPQEIIFSGTIQRFPPRLIGMWVIEGHTVVVTRPDQVEGIPEVGKMATVRALRYSNGVLKAIKIVIPEPTEHVRTITGTLLHFPQHLFGWWQIGEYRVLVTTQTVIVGRPIVGHEATAKVVLGNGTLLALHIEISPEGPTVTVTPRPSVTPQPSRTPDVVEFAGEIEQLPETRYGEWVIGGFTVVVNRRTVIVGEPAVGLRAKVRALRMADGTLHALRIEILGGGATPTPEEAQPAAQGTPEARQFKAVGLARH